MQIPVWVWYAAFQGSRWNRVLPGSEQTGEGQVDFLNLVLIVGFALVITFLAQYLARRGGRRK